MGRHISQVAFATPYSNSSSGIPFTNVNDAIDYLLSVAVFNPSKTMRFYEDWCGGDYTSIYSWLNNSSGTGANVSIGDPNTIISNNHQGVARLFTGTTATGRAVLYVNVSNLILGGGEMVVDIPVYMAALSTAGQTFRVRVGLGDGNASADHTNGVYWDYIHSTSSGNWVGKTASSGSRTSLDSLVPAATGWTRLTFIVNAAGTSVTYYVNGVSVGSNTTNIPTGNTQWVTPILKIVKTVGTTSVELDVDYFFINQTFTVPR